MRFSVSEACIPQLRGKSTAEKQELYKALFSRYPHLLWLRGGIGILSTSLMFFLIIKSSAFPYGWIIALTAPLAIYVLMYGFIVGPMIKNAFSELATSLKNAEQGAAANP